LLILLAVQTVSLMLFFSIKQNVVKSKMQGLSKEEVSREQIQTYVFSLNDFETIERDGGKEFCLNGWMYDITFSAVKNEGKLLRRFVDLFRKSQDKKDMTTTYAFLYSLSLPMSGEFISFRFEPTEIADVFYTTEPSYVAHSFLTSFFQPPEFS
jgi:hypothetical protein